MSAKFDLRAAWPLWRIVKEAKYELIHAHTPRTAMIGRIVSALSGRPLVYHVHSPTSRDSTRCWSNRVNAATERTSLRGAAHLICVSKSLGRHMRQIGFREQQVSVVPNGVPHVRPVQRNAPTRDWMLGTVALFRPRKGIEILLEALASLRTRFPVKLRAVGPFESPAYEAKLKSQAVRLGLERAVEWTGCVRDVNAELELMDLFVLPSLFGEGLPMVVLEAMAAGVPVVGTRVEGIPEAVRDGLDGVIAEPGDAKGLEEAIGRVMSGELDWSRLRVSATTRHSEQFSDEIMAGGVASAYRRILGESRS
jgi:glycosyltransferase involved in cell wall biosynthesis